MCVPIYNLAQVPAPALQPFPFPPSCLLTRLCRSWSESTLDVSDKDVIPQLKADVLSVHSVQVVLISPLSTLLPPSAPGRNVTKQAHRAALGPGGSQVTALICEEH